MILPPAPIFPTRLSPSQRLAVIEAVRRAEERLLRFAQADAE